MKLKLKLKLMDSDPGPISNMDPDPSQYLKVGTNQLLKKKNVFLNLQFTVLLTKVIFAPFLMWIGIAGSTTCR